MSASDFQKTPVVILSSVEWEATWQRHQALAVQWAQAGHPVYFVENTGFRDPSWGDFKRLARKGWRLIFPRRKRNSAARVAVQILNPVVLPPTGPLFQALNKAWFVPRLAERLFARGVPKGAIAIAYLPTATTLALLDALDPRLTVYDCVDNFRGHPKPPADLEEAERALTERSDIVLTTSPTLFEEKAKIHRRVRELHHGVSDPFFIEAPLKRTHKRFCYFGTLWGALDYEAVAALAEAGYDVELIGPQKEPPPPLPARARLRRPMPHDKLPAALRQYDALILPYRQTEYNKGVVPAKLYECLATGLPVIASPIPALRRFGDVLSLAEGPAQWRQAARELDGDTAQARQRRLELAGAHRQERLFAELREEVRALWEAPRRPPASGSAATPRPDPLRPLWRGLTWIGFFYGLSKAASLLAQIAAGRWLGPAAYGQANLVIAAAAYLQILPMLGFPLALAKYLPQTEGERQRAGLVSSALAVFTAWSAIALALVLRESARLGSWLGVPPELFDAAVVLGFLTAAYTVLASPLLGLRRFRERGLTEALYGLTLPVFLFLLLSRARAGYASLIGAFCLSLIAATLAALWLLRPLLRPRLERRGLGELLRYSLVASLNYLAVACVLAPGRLALSRLGAAADVGIFSAYFTATGQISLALQGMISAVLLPLSSGDAAGALPKRLLALAAPLAVGAWLFFLATGAAGISLAGRQYPFDARLLALFSSAAALMLLHGAAAALFAARGFRGLCVSVAGALGTGLANAALAWKLAAGHGVAGAAAALACSFTLGLAFYAAAWSRGTP